MRGLMDVPGGRHVKDVLVVDDERSLRLLCRVNLELEGHTVLEAATVAEARRELELATPDVVLLDIHVGDDDGLELLDEIAALELPTRVVLLSGTSEVGPELRARVDSRAREALRAAAALSRRLRRPTAPVGSPDVSVTGVRTPVEYEERLARYLFERSEEGRAVRVGEKETSEQAAIVERYRDLFSPGQIDVLREAENAAEGGERERLYRLRKTCEAGIVSAELAAREDELENRILAARVDWRGEELPLRTAQAKLAVLPVYADRDELGSLANAVSAGFNDDRRDLLAAGEALEAELSGEPDAIARNGEEKGISLHELERALDAAARASTGAYDRLRERWFEKLLGPDRDDVPTSNHTSYLRRLSPLEQTYTKERAVEVCMATLQAIGLNMDEMPGIRLDLDDRPQKSPRACVIASDPPNVVHLITRAQGGLHDYQAFLHEAGHALHYASVDPALPYTFRKISRDHALTEIYSYIVEAISREPGWHAEHFGLDDEQAAENAEATVFLEALLFRRYAAKLRYELGFWGRFAEDGGTPGGYSEYLTEATGIRYPAENYLSDMDSGFYSADYLRAWIRSAQLRQYLVREVGEDWWRRPETGERLLALWREGTRPTSEEIASRIGYEPFDTGPLLHELGA